MNFLFYLLTSSLYIISFPNFNYSWAAWICLVPLVLAVDCEKSLRLVVAKSLIAGWIIFLGSMYWLTKVTVLGWILLTFYMAWYVVLFAIARFYNKSFIAIPAAWTALEFIRSNFLSGIPWLLLGASQYNCLPLIQISNITGVYGVSFIVALTNAGIVGIFRKKYFGFVTAVFVIILTLVYGKYILDAKMPEQKIMVGIVQPNVNQDVKWDPKHINWMVKLLEGLTYDMKQSCGNIDLIVWPETAVPTFMEDKNLFNKICTLVKITGCDFIVGTQGVEKDGVKKYYNSAFLISKEGIVVGEYRKMHLVPFGEYVPFNKTFPFLEAFTPIEDGFTPGREYSVLRSKINLSILICFEDILPGLARQFVKRGADILVNITNDGWFGKTNAIYQHASLSVFRAVENGVPLVRATNTGLSCFIDCTGKIQLVGPFTAIGRTGEILVRKRNTFYTKYGDIFGWLCVIGLISIGGRNVRRVKERFRTA